MRLACPGLHTYSSRKGTFERISFDYGEVDGFWLGTSEGTVVGSVLGIDEMEGIADSEGLPEG